MSFIFLVSGFSGSGKTSLCSELLKENQNTLERCVTCTTRAPRSNEVNGVDYNFYTRSEFEEMIQNDEFVEYSNVYENYYGLQKSSLLEVLNVKEKNALFAMDQKGVQNMTSSGFSDRIKTVFISVPTVQDLKNRIKNRNENAQKDVEKRLGIIVLEESKIALKCDFVINNDDFKKALASLDLVYKSCIACDNNFKEKLINSFLSSIE